MKYSDIFHKLEKNIEVFKTLLDGVSKEEYLWRQSPGKWCMLEVVCHLYDEEREDFRTRLLYALEGSEVMPPRIDPVAWVKERNYMDKMFDLMLEKFVAERIYSVNSLYLLRSPNWDNYFTHPDLGKMTAHKILSNWLAHDYLHMRQIIRLKYDYLKEISGESLSYAGEW